MRVVIISQARMTSTRLPGKVMLEVLGKPLLEYHVERLKRVSLADELVVATTTNDTDQPIVDLCEKLGVKFFRGSEEDVLSRYYYAACEYNADAVVRVTSDCPIIDPEIVGRVIEVFLQSYPKYNYVSNGLKRTYPRGMDVEVFSFSTLKEAYYEALEPQEREHVTPYIYRRPERYSLLNVAHEIDQSNYRLTVDTLEDFSLIKLILENLYLSDKYFNLQDCLNLLENNPDWIKINNFIKQKDV